MTSIEPQQRLPPLRSEILDMMSFIKDHIMPGLASEDMLISEDKLIRSNANMEGILGIPPSSFFFPLFLSSIVRHDLESRKELLKLHLPIEHDTGWNDYQMRSPLTFVAGEMSEQGYSLDSFATG